MLYDVRKGYYVAYSYHANENNALKLDKFSYIDENGNKVYSGIIYVRTYLMNVNGASETFEVKLNIYNYDRDADGNYNKSSTPKLVASQRKFLLTQYNPGVTLSVKNALTGKIGTGNNSTQVYLIEKTSNNVRVYARIYGYEINQQPSISLSWLKEDDVNDIARYVNISQGSVIEDNGAYLVEFVLKTSNLDKPFVFKMSLSLAGEGEIIESEEKTITFYPVEYIPTKVYLRGSSNDNVRVAVNSSYYFELVWLSANQSLNSSEINSKLFDENGNVLQYFYTTYYDTYGRLIDDYLQIQ